ncbi:unnamed protein product [Blepharisma stoltei]|uniref:Calcineurin-like phosphoesterase domain-containing protein n=1 Tax=Blepharisma stoltei TaxID=1481888 RepID=A0AAU9KDU0_9CILI|nr:unnamed protein product [Blepharisma stoltei]
MKESYIAGIVSFILICVCIAILIMQVISKGDKEKLGKFSLVDGEFLRAHIIGDYGELRKSHELKNGKWYVEYVAEKMREISDTQPISMVISVGDNIYNKPKGSFDERNFKLMDKIFSEGSIGMKPWYLVLGNHDCRSDYSTEIDMSKLYRNWNMPKPYWNSTINIGNSKKVSVIYLNTCEIGCETTKTFPHLLSECEDNKEKYSNKKINKQYSWLESTLSSLYKDPSISWLIVVMHMPMFSASKAHGDNEQLKTRLYPLLFKYNVDLVLAGHDHLMQYMANKKASEPTPFEPKVNDTDSLDCGYLEYVPYQREVEFDKGEYLHQVVMGAGGGDLDPICPKRVTDMAELLYANTNYGFAELYADPDLLSINFYEYNSSQPVFTANIHSYNLTGVSNLQKSN